MFINKQNKFQSLRTLNDTSDAVVSVWDPMYILSDDRPSRLTLLFKDSFKKIWFCYKFILALRVSQDFEIF